MASCYWRDPQRWTNTGTRNHLHVPVGARDEGRAMCASRDSVSSSLSAFAPFLSDRKAHFTDTTYVRNTLIPFRHKNQSVIRLRKSCDVAWLTAACRPPGPPPHQTLVLQGTRTSSLEVQRRRGAEVGGAEAQRRRGAGAQSAGTVQSEHACDGARTFRGQRLWKSSLAHLLTRGRQPWWCARVVTRRMRADGVCQKRGGGFWSGSRREGRVGWGGDG